MTLPTYVGRYEVRQEIARGGFAVVVQAWDEELESLVALKILHQVLADDEHVRLRFLEEARLLRRIRAPSVVTVHDVGRLNDGRPYFVMDFADRGTLDARLERRSALGPPDSQSIMALVDAVADGLSALHEVGVVHRDIKPANVLFQLVRRGTPAANQTGTEAPGSGEPLVETNERILLGDLGIAKDLARHGSFPTIIGGTPLYQAPEQSNPDAKVTPAADVYAATALLWHLLISKRPPPVHAVAAQLDGLPLAWHPVFQQGLALEPENRFATMESWRSAVHDALGHQVADTPLRFATPAQQSTAPCPYKGLAAYQVEDACFFFGRESLIDELVRRIQLQRVLAVGGPSGSGKSSVVRAGLIPALHAGALPGSETWRVAVFTPGRDPMAELHFQLTRLAPARKPPISLADLMEHPTMARHLGWTNGSEAPLLLCIDQFEELFTLAPSAQRSKFVAALSAMADPADSSVRIVIAVRADFYAGCAQMPWLAERITANQVLVGPMTGPELRRAISEPARPVGLHLERGLVEAIITEAGDEAGSLPLVAHALVETWRRRQGNTLTLEGYRAAGGVAGAISQTADAIYDSRLDETEREVTKRLFLRLVTPGEDAPDTRRILPRSEIDQDPDPVGMHRVEECLTDARLLTVDDNSIQIAHEALLRTWPRLRSWIEGCRDDLRTRQRISRAAAEWDSEGRDPDLLYRGTPLVSALEWAANHPDQLGMLERAFLDTAEETTARAEAAAADKRRRRRRLRRTAIAMLSVLALGATFASAAAFLAWREAQRNALRAERATVEAHQRFSAALGAVAHGLVDSDPLLALYLAAEAAARADEAPPGYDARATLVEARRALAQPGPVLVGSPIPAGDAIAIAMSPDGLALAAAQRDGGIDLIDTVTRRRTGPSLRGHVGGIRDVDFGPEGRALASVGADGTVRLWNVDDGLSGRGTKIGEIADVVSGVCFAPHGAYVASANGDGTVRLWDVERGAAAGGPLIQRALGFKVIEFSPDGRGLLAGYNDGTIFGWKLPSREPLFEPIRGAHTSNLSQLAFSPMADRFATASTDGTSMVFEYPSGRVVGPAFGQSGQVGAVVFTRDGRFLVGGGADGALRLWELEQQKVFAATPKGHSQAIIDAVLSDDGSLLATLGLEQLIRLWSITDGYPLSTVRKVDGRSAKGVAFSPDGRQLAAGDDTGTVHLWATEADEAPVRLHGHGHQVWALAFSPDGTLLASGDRDGQVRLWSTADGALQSTLPTHQGAVWSLAFTPDGARLVSASDVQISIWDVQAGHRRGTLRPDGGRITRAILSPDGSLLAVVSTDGRVRLWNTERATLASEIVADDNVLWSVAFSPDARKLATASSDEVVALWDPDSGAREATFTGLTGGATDVAFLADGVTLVAADRSGGLHLWDVETGRRLSDGRQAHSQVIWRIAVHPDGERFATAGGDGQVRIWEELSRARACEIAGPAFDAVRRRQYLGEGERSMACE